MSLPHVLMLGLIDGASVGTVVDPPATVGELANLSVEQFYAVDMRPNRYEPRPLTKRQWQFLRQVIAARKRERIRAMRDTRYHAALERQMRKALNAA
jgi:hypothetical protein